jgi:hypothetical protein
LGGGEALMAESVVFQSCCGSGFEPVDVADPPGQPAEHLQAGRGFRPNADRWNGKKHNPGCYGHRP